MIKRLTALAAMVILSHTAAQAADPPTQDTLVTIAISALPSGQRADGESARRYLLRCDAADDAVDYANSVVFCVKAAELSAQLASNETGFFRDFWLDQEAHGISLAAVGNQTIAADKSKAQLTSALRILADIQSRRPTEHRRAQIGSIQHLLELFSATP